jgi:hypothetical protein
MIKQEEAAYKLFYPSFGSYTLGVAFFGEAYYYIPVDPAVKIIANGDGKVSGHIV